MSILGLALRTFSTILLFAPLMYSNSSFNLGSTGASLGLDEDFASFIVTGLTVIGFSGLITRGFSGYNLNGFLALVSRVLGSSSIGLISRSLSDRLFSIFFNFF